MSLLNIFNISGSGLSAQSLRMNTIASNISNAETTSSSVDQVYRARHPVFTTQISSFSGFLSDAFEPTMGVDVPGGVRVAGVVEDQSPLPRRFEPDHPMADEEGYVTYPNVNIVEEMADMISASRSYQMNASMMESGKAMMERLLTVGQS